MADKTLAYSAGTGTPNPSKLREVQQPSRLVLMIDNPCLLMSFMKLKLSTFFWILAIFCAYLGGRSHQEAKLKRLEASARKILDTERSQKLLDVDELHARLELRKLLGMQVWD